MIDYVEIRNGHRQLIGIVDNATSVIWGSEYYGTGRFEIYVRATAQTAKLLEVENYVTRPNDVNIGVIENVNITWTPQEGRMIIASGRFAKSILDRRVIYSLSGTSVKPTVLGGEVQMAVRHLVRSNIIASSQAYRNVSFIKLGEYSNIHKLIVDEEGKAAMLQARFEGLLSYTDSLLRDYHLGAYMRLDRDTRNLLYNVYEGKDRSMGNTAGNAPVIFSQEFDNLLSSNYTHQDTAFKNTALIGGEGEGLEQFCVLIGGSNMGLARREVFVDAKSQGKTYTEETTNEAGEAVEVERTYTDAEYTALLKAHGHQDLTQRQIVETFTGEVDVMNSDKVFGVDFWIGDIVTIYDTHLSAYINTRILTATEVQDENGYKLAITYGV